MIRPDTHTSQLEAEPGPPIRACVDFGVGDTGFEPVTSAV